MKTHLLYCFLLLFLLTYTLLGQEPDASGICGLEGADTTTLLLLTRPSVSQLPYTIHTTHFVVHYATSGIDAFTASDAQNVGVMAESCWSVQCVRSGWRTPLQDGARGGDSLYDIYIRHFYIEGTNPDTSGATPNDAGSRTNYILLANRFAGGSDASNQVLAHEFNHSCQWSYVTAFKAWTWEGTADWMMKEVFHSVYCYGVYRAHASGSISLSDQKLTEHTYANALFFQFLQERWTDTDMVRSLWERFDATGGSYPLSDMNNVISVRHSSSLTLALRDYAIWRRFTGIRADGRHFQNDSLYATVVEASFTAPFTMDNSSSQQKPSGPGGCRFWNIKSGMGNLTVSFDGQNNHEWAVFLIAMRAPDSSSVYEIPVSTSLDTGRITVNTSGVDSFTVVPVVLDTSNANNLTFSVTASFVPTSQVTFSNRIHSGEAGGNLLLDNVDSLASGQSRNLVQGSSHIIRALNERFTTDSVYKHHDWNSIFNRKSLADTFVVSISGFQEEDANFLALNSVTLRNEIVGAPFFDGGTILFRDPWYLNSVGVQPDTFMAFSSPLSPTGAYNDTNRGVFLNQGGNPLTPPYYSVRAPLTQTIGNFQCTFVAWQATGATLVQTDSNPSGYDQKAVVFNSANAVVKARYRATIASITSQLAAKWNIVSVPDTVSDFRKNTLWPRASSHAFAYQSGAYVRKDTAENGKGYWLKFSSIDSSSYVGPPIFKDTIPLGIGWNLIGSLSLPIRTASIDTSGTGMQLSKYYGYSGTYSAVDTIKPGNGYWVKSYASGAIILDLASTSNNPASSSGVLPPPPTSPVSLIPTDGETNVSPTPTLSWEEVISAASYTVEVYSGATYVTGATVEGTSWTVPGGELSSSTTYSWQVQACNLECSEWSTATFTTAAPAPAPTLTGSYVTVNNVKHPYLSWTVPQGMGGSYQIYRYLCPPSGGDCFGSASLIATTSITHYTDLDFVYVKINPVSLAWYYVRADGGTSAPSNHVGIGTNAAQVQMHQNQEEESVELKEQKPDAFELFQNYPNGFNPTTQIRYALPFDIDVSLKVYDMLGRVVATLVEENQSAGFKTVEFNADKLSSGIYIYRLIAGDFTAVKKMIIVK